MVNYVFFLEYDGRRHYEAGPNARVETIKAGTTEKAFKKFANKKKLKLESYDLLADNSYRLFFYKKPLFKKPIEIVYRATLESQNQIVS
ncbi:hypothetical protein PU629_03800 [Pullulanibacillus sp. KACC 23026]|uniref:hypothetical protein n=1 Tax=Pullulanibacillus sp. KACC 23026 TaxID=3028315 RepID=UPI0023B074B3|nr:hypothetical protein [Pullulanibacillus sp. KACC 23026]WEG13502.1 hypothetical protein PU629_03800 [Pullulanibacillus sp. KACC 23026]